MKETDHLIWTDHDLDIEDWRESLEEQYPGYSEDELYEKMYKTNAENLDDERANLNIQLSRPIIILGDIGRWNGRVFGYKEIESGNIKDCLYSENDYNTWFVDEKGDLRCDSIHHDGTNHYLYRAYKSSATDEQIEDLKEKLYNGNCTESDIERVTRRLGDEIGRVYGWSFPKIEKQREVGAR